MELPPLEPAARSGLGMGRRLPMSQTKRGGVLSCTSPCLGEEKGVSFRTGSPGRLLKASEPRRPSGDSATWRFNVRVEAQWHRIRLICS